MKCSIIIRMLALTILLFTNMANAQRKTIEIGAATITYDHGKFIIAGIECDTVEGEDHERDLQGNVQTPSLKILIETGDGNYIEDNISYDDLSDGEHSLPGGEQTFVYKTDGPFNVTVTMVKTYDKGGPRTRKLRMEEFRPGYYNENANNMLPYPQEAFKITIFDNKIVQGDTTTGVITINRNHPIPPQIRLYLDIDKLLVRPDTRAYGVGLELETPEDNGRSFITPMEIRDMPNEAVTNIFFDLVPSGEIETGQNLIFGILDQLGQHYLADPGLIGASSHDPNQLILPLQCSSLSTNIFTFILDIENEGLAPETDISVGLKFSLTQFDWNSLEISGAYFGGLYKPWSIQTKLRNAALCDSLGNSEIAVLFGKEKLEGTNTLPTGDPLTRARMGFSLKLRPGMDLNENISIQAFIYFRSANELTPTKEVTFTLADVKRVCDYKSSCPSPSMCRICSVKGFNLLWLCK